MFFRLLSCCSCLALEGTRVNLPLYSAALLGTFAPLLLSLLVPQTYKQRFLSCVPVRASTASPIVVALGVDTLPKLISVLYCLR